VHNAANEWEAFGVYWQDDKRIYSMAIVRNPATPRTPGVVAMHHHMMKRAVQTNKVFDFEGSDLPGVHDFNAGFGATDETYWEIRRTHPLLRRRKP
jgi:hypothetical protein